MRFGWPARQRSRYQAGDCRPETEILDKLGIRWRDGRPHINCPYPAHQDRRASWRWGVEKRAAFCTCIEKAHSIFDVIMGVLACDFSIACFRAAEMLGRRDLTCGASRDRAAPRGLVLAAYAKAKGLPEDFLCSLGLADIDYGRSSAVVLPYRSMVLRSRSGIEFGCLATGFDGGRG